MPRPNIVRADTLDLQNTSAPTAQNHSNGPNSPRSANGFAPHQQQAIRQVAEEQALAQNSQISIQNQTHQQMDDRDGDELDRELADAEIAGEEGGFDDDDMMDKMSSSPSIVDEDIDFQMVYALHKFDATVEGQADVSKGEHMMLLDDSNSYWWLVRVIKNNTVGYLPAEYIETPMERLARLNKHRNIDLATTMLSDSNHEKSKNPLKKAMRRRHAKSVAFTTPTYHEAPIYEYSDEEEGEGEGEIIHYEEEETVAETEHVEGDDRKEANGVSMKVVDDKKVNGKADPGVNSDVSRPADDGLKMRANPTPAALRHPDSAIFHDETQGTKKLTLTPNILRDDGTADITAKEVIKARTSYEKDKPGSQKREDLVLSPPPGKDGKKLKKGSSVLGNLFKKRNKKGRKDEDDEVDDWLHKGSNTGEKQSIDSSRSMDSVLERQISQESDGLREDATKKQRMHQQIQQQQREQQEREQRQRELQQRELQQQQREQKLREQEQRQQREYEQKAQQQSNSHAAAIAAAVGSATSTIRRVGSDGDDKLKSAAQMNGYGGHSEHGQTSPSVRAPTNGSPDTARKYGFDQDLGPENTTVRDKSPNRDPASVHRAQQKISLDKSQSLNTYQPHHQKQPSIERLSESPEQITYHDATDRPDLLLDTSSGAESSSPIDSSPELIDRSSAFDTVTSPSTTITPAPSHTITRTWSDWSLKTYFEDDNDVKDMLIVVKQDKGDNCSDKTHPDIMPLFEEPNRRLADITMQLDGMLGEWLSRRAKV